MIAGRCGRCGGSRYQDGDEEIVCYLCGETTYLTTDRQRRLRQEIDAVKADLVLHPIKRGCPKGTRRRTTLERIARAQRDEQIRTAETLARQKLALALYRNDWTQTEIAREFGVTQTTISRLLVQEIARERLAATQSAYTPQESFVGTAS